MSLDLTVPHAELVHFLKLIMPMNCNDSERREMITAPIISLMTKLTKIVSGPIPKDLIFTPEDREYSNIGKAAISIYKNFTKEYRQLRADFLIAKNELLRQLLVWMEKCMDCNLYFLFDDHEYFNCIDDQFMTDPIIKKKINQIKAMINNIKYNKYEVKRTQISDCLIDLRINSTGANVALDHANFSTFDTSFLNFLYDNDLIKRFTSFAEQTLKNDNFIIKPEDLRQLNTSFVLLLQPQNHEEQATIRSAIRRISFAVIYGYRPNIMDVKNSVKLMNNAKNYSMMTPSELGIAEFVPVSYRDVPARKMIDSQLALKNSIKDIGYIQFMFSPADIAYQIFMMLTKIQDWVSQQTGKSGKMAFDDVLSFFTPMLAYEMPPNALAIANYLKRVQFPNSATLDFSRLIFISACELVEEHE